MPTIINAAIGGYVVTADTSGTLELQASGNTALTLNSSRAVGVGQTPSFGTAGQVLTSQGSATAPTWTAASIPSNATITNPTITNYTETTFTANSSTAITVDLANGTVQVITLTGNCTITMPTATAGKSFTLLLKTGAGGFTVTWSATTRWPGGTAPTLTSAATKLDKFVFTSDGTNWYGSNAGQNYSA
jgi:hypothetical protein